MNYNLEHGIVCMCMCTHIKIYLISASNQSTVLSIQNEKKLVLFYFWFENTEFWFELIAFYLTVDIFFCHTFMCVHKCWNCDVANHNHTIDECIEVSHNHTPYNAYFFPVVLPVCVTITRNHDKREHTHTHTQAHTSSNLLSWNENAMSNTAMCETKNSNRTTYFLITNFYTLSFIWGESDRGRECDDIKHWHIRGQWTNEFVIINSHCNDQILLSLCVCV